MPLLETLTTRVADLLDADDEERFSSTLRLHCMNEARRRLAEDFDVPECWQVQSLLFPAGVSYSALPLTATRVRFFRYTDATGSVIKIREPVSRDRWISYYEASAETSSDGPSKFHLFSGYVYVYPAFVSESQARIDAYVLPADLGWDPGFDSDRFLTIYQSVLVYGAAIVASEWLAGFEDLVPRWEAVREQKMTTMMIDKAEELAGDLPKQERPYRVI